MKKKQFRIQFKETGEAMEYFDTLIDAQCALNHQEYSIIPDLYEIVERTLDGTYKPVEL
jgi:hypothetical protein